MTVDVKSVQAVIYAQSKKWDDRKKHLEAIFSRHECDVLSSFHWDEKEEAHNYLVQCKDYVIEPVVAHCWCCWQSGKTKSGIPSSHD